MSLDLRDQLYEFIKSHHKGIKYEDREIKTDKLKPTLRPYQCDAVQWMLDRELTMTGTYTIDDEVINYPKGGILADEMGLGKTVEVLACILSNPYVPSPNPEGRVKLGKRKINDNIPVSDGKHSKIDEPIKLNKKTTIGLYSDKYKNLLDWYESSLLETKSPRYSTPKQENNLQCFCTNAKFSDSDTISCCECGSQQHSKCVGYEEDQEDDYYCPQCWSNQTPVKSRATFIITPSTISSQWINEIQKHIGDDTIKVLVYEGVKERKYYQPPKLADYDIVITTYQVLCVELYYSSKDEGSTRKLRHAKRYFSPITPLTSVEWWRVCLDEAQMVEGSTSKTATMARQLHAHYRWAVTGTPIQKSLQVEPYRESSQWKKLIWNPSKLNQVLAPIMWRNCKENVFSMLGIPPQTIITHTMSFSPVEKYFYEQMHKVCATLFQAKLAKYPDPSITISSISKYSLNSLLNPFLCLRQACTHPQVIRGKFVKYKHTMTMDELLVEMISKTKVDFESELRQVICTLNGISALQIILQNWSQAVDYYRKVLQMSTEYEKIAKMLHTLYNLAWTLENHGTGIPPTLRDSSLYKDAEELEKTYLQKIDSRFLSVKSKADSKTDIIELTLCGKVLGYSSWWAKVLNWAPDPDDLLDRIVNYLEDNKVPRQTSIIKRLKNLLMVERELSIWLADIDCLRCGAIEVLKYLGTQPKAELAMAASTCHLDNKKRKKKKTQCSLCYSEEKLELYEQKLFSINPDGNSEYSDSDDDSITDHESEAAKLKVNLLKTKKEGSWKPAEYERILMVLSTYAKAKKAPVEWINESVEHLSILVKVRQEFIHLRSEWKHLSNAVSARDELSMARMRLRLAEGDEILSDNRRATQKPDIFVIQDYEVEIQLQEQELMLIHLEQALKKTSGILLYLQNLEKKDPAKDKCPICQEEFQEKWSVLECGHCLCLNCLPTLLNMAFNSRFNCPLCRESSFVESISYVLATRTENTDDEIKVVGSFSTKVLNVTSKLLELIKNEPKVKVLVFSTWQRVLDIISESFRVNQISYRRLDGSSRHTSLTQFKNSAVSALLMPLHAGSKGLNIIEASHVFFVEPVLNPADELQAVGRVHRIGQTKPTFVHRFIMLNTIEEKMLSSLECNKAQETTTLSELCSLMSDTSASEDSINFDQNNML